MTNPFDLSGKTALVTGANTGLGQGMAIALAEAGADIVLVGRSAPTETLAKIKAAGRTAYDVRADLMKTDAAKASLSEAVSAAGQIDILVNNAGIVQHCISRKSGGKIVNVASMLSFQGGIRVASYTASKSGVMGLTRLMANEWAGHGINANAIAPGYFATNNTKALQADEARNAAIIGRIPAGHWGKPEELGGAVVFLASKAADYVHGITLPVDGGWLAR